MWLSRNILSNLVDLNDIDPKELGLRLTMSSAEIDGIDYTNAHFKTIFTCKLLEVKKHPDSDHLTIVKADTSKAIYDVICGATNHKAGDIAVIAIEGTKFSDEFIIKKTKIRGVESNGMLCSLRELGLSEDHSGILILPPDTPLGVPLSELFKEWVDIRYEIDNKSITHRPDLWGHLGFAREISSLYGRPLKSIVDYSLENEFSSSDNLSVTIKCPDQAPRYCGLVIKNIKVAESPEWLKSAVVSIGMRPINNIVDITNYVMAEVGEPMHAFDRKKLNGNEIIVRMADSGEVMTTLDAKERTLTSDDIVIADKSGAIAIAGVMGGGNSEIDDNTTEIVLEAANFNPINIRKTAGRFTLRTDAAIRFEKSLDPEICKTAILRCYELIKKIIPSAEAVSKIIDAYPKKAEEKKIEISTDNIRKYLGADISDDRIISILTSLGFAITNVSGLLNITVPSYRATKDISIPMDIVEEIGRIFGYDNIKPEAPYVPCEPPLVNSKRQIERKIKSILSGNNNMIEVYNYSFTGEEILNKSCSNNDKELRLKNPLSSEHDRLRLSLVPGIISNIARNEKNSSNFKIYELGRTYHKIDRNDKTLAEEISYVTGAVVCDDAVESSTPFYTAKGAVKDLLRQLKISKVRFIPVNDNLPSYVHPGRAVYLQIEGKVAGMVFELHPKVKQSFEVRGRAALFDLNVDMLLSAVKSEIVFEELQKYPGVPFEISLITDKKVYANDIAEIIQKSDRLVKSSQVIAVYEGAPIPEDKKSVSVRIIFAANDRTLTAQEIESLQKKVIAAMEKKGYNLR